MEISIANAAMLLLAVVLVAATSCAQQVLGMLSTKPGPQTASKCKSEAPASERPAAGSKRARKVKETTYFSDELADTNGTDVPAPFGTIKGVWIVKKFCKKCNPAPAIKKATIKFRAALSPKPKECPGSGNRFKQALTTLGLKFKSVIKPASAQTTEQPSSANLAKATTCKWTINLTFVKRVRLPTFPTLEVPNLIVKLKALRPAKRAKVPLANNDSALASNTAPVTSEAASKTKAKATKAALNKFLTSPVKKMWANLFDQKTKAPASTPMATVEGTITTLTSPKKATMTQEFLALPKKLRAALGSSKKSKTSAVACSITTMAENNTLPQKRTLRAFPAQVWAILTSSKRNKTRAVCVPAMASDSSNNIILTEMTTNNMVSSGSPRVSSDGSNSSSRGSNNVRDMGLITNSEEVLLGHRPSTSGGAPSTNDAIMEVTSDSLPGVSGDDAGDATSDTGRCSSSGGSSSTTSTKRNVFYRGAHRVYKRSDESLDRLKAAMSGAFQDASRGLSIAGDNMVTGCDKLVVGTTTLTKTASKRWKGACHKADKVLSAWGAELVKEACQAKVVCSGAASKMGAVSTKVVQVFVTSA